MNSHQERETYILCSQYIQIFETKSYLRIRCTLLGQILGVASYFNCQSGVKSNEIQSVCVYILQRYDRNDTIPKYLALNFKIVIMI